MSTVRVVDCRDSACFSARARPVSDVIAGLPRRW
jgi:hypothetical protein